MKKVFLFIFIFLGYYCFSQTYNDSLAIKNAQWKIDTLSKNLVLKTISIQNRSLFKSNQTISILEIDTSLSEVKMEFVYSDTLTKTSSYCKKNNAFAAINGTFFFMKSGISTDYIRIHHQRVAINYPKDGHRKSYKNGLLALFDDSPQLSIILPDTNLYFEDSLSQPSILTSGPMLIYKDSLLSFIQNSFSLSRHARTGVAITHDNKILWIVVDGYQSRAAGMSLKEFAQTARILDAEYFLNLDGGGSSTLFINKENYGIINHPSDNGKFDHAGERRVASAVLLYLN